MHVEKRKTWKQREMEENQQRLFARFNFVKKMKVDEEYNENDRGSNRIKMCFVGPSTNSFGNSNYSVLTFLTPPPFFPVNNFSFD